MYTLAAKLDVSGGRSGLRLGVVHVTRGTALGRFPPPLQVKTRSFSCRNCDAISPVAAQETYHTSSVPDPINSAVVVPWGRPQIALAAEKHHKARPTIFLGEFCTTTRFCALCCELVHKVNANVSETDGLSQTSVLQPKMQRLLSSVIALDVFVKLDTLHR